MCIRDRSDTSPQLGGNLDTNSKNIVFGDSSGTTVNRLTFGGQADLKLFHDGTNSVITNATGDLYINNNADTIIKPANDLFIKPQDGESGIDVIGNGAVNLYHDNGLRFSTKSNGFESFGGQFLFYGVEGGASQLLIYADEGDDLNDRWRVMAGGSNDFEIGNLADGS